MKATHLPTSHSDKFPVGYESEHFCITETGKKYLIEKKRLTAIFKQLAVFGLFFLSANTGLAYTFGEHKLAGDNAMKLFFSQNNAFTNTVFGKYVPISFNEQSNTYILTDLSAHQFPITYGTLNGLSGDHAEHPLSLEQQLRTANSDLLRVLAVHNDYIKRGFSTAPASELLKLNKKFGYLALVSLCHFHAYGKGLKGNIKGFDAENVDKIISPSMIEGVFGKLNGSNLINMYITVHAAAVYLAEMAGVKAKDNEDEEARKYLYYAFLYNGFADHFLEDGFCSGHLVVNRSIFTSIVNNKPLHDFYCKNGTDVVNIRGEIWHEYGDGLFNTYHNAYTKVDSLKKLEYPEKTTATKRVIEAVSISISELYEAFDRGYQQGAAMAFIANRIPTESAEAKTRFFVDNFKALHIVPLPYNTDLKTLMPDSLANDKRIKETNQLLYYRNFVRSRIANSVIIGGNAGFIGDKTNAYSNAYIRVNAGMINSKYKLNENYNKKGMVDIWNGYTASYTFGEFVQNNNQQVLWNNWTLKGGTRTNFDVWFSEKRFLGFYMYNEIGMERKFNTNAFVYVPQLGIQLGSLLRINYYNMPAWLRIPLQLFLPLSLHVGCVYSAKNVPFYFLGTEVNLVL